jgi:hypothetical protein
MARNSKQTVAIAEATHNKCSFNTNTKEGNLKQAEQKTAVYSKISPPITYTFQ